MFVLADNNIKNAMEKCMGFLLYTEFVKMPSLADYRSKAECCQNIVVSKTKSLNKFKLILRY